MSLQLKDITEGLTDGIAAALGRTITVDANEYPVYVTMPKVAPDNYVYIGGVTQTENGTKDDFIYEGTIQIRVTTDNLHTGEKKLARSILNYVRGVLKPSKPYTISLDDLNLISLSHGSLTELVTQTDTNLIRIDLIDIYDFILE